LRLDQWQEKACWTWQTEFAEIWFGLENRKKIRQIFTE